MNQLRRLVIQGLRIRASIDGRGYLTVENTLLKDANLHHNKFVQIFADKKSKVIAFKFYKKEEVGSFALVKQGKNTLIFVKGALKSIAIAKPNSKMQLIKKDEWWVLALGVTLDFDNLVHFPCRSTRNIPMVSINKRGTLILNKSCLEYIDTSVYQSVNASFNSEKQKFILEFFEEEGFLSVRTIGSHAEISFMGTLSSFGFKMSSITQRIKCEISKNILVFSVK